MQAEVTTEDVQVEVPYEVKEEVPKALYIMLDQSGSMVTDDLSSILSQIPIIGALFPPGTNKWKLAVNGLTQFVNDTGSAALKVALRYFPKDGQCDGTGYDTPSVPMDIMTVNAANVIASLTAEKPTGNTPTAGALRGIINYCLKYQADHPKEQCVGVLVTDGDPTDCDPRDAQGLGQLAADAKAKGIQIYAAGMQGASFATLDEIGKQGGGDCTPNDPQTYACNMTSSPDAFLKALQAISSQTSVRTRTETRTETHSSVLACQWKIPDTKDGTTFDKDQVNLRYTGKDSPETNVGAIESQNDCGQVPDGWYYDSAASPKNILVCPQTCTKLNALTAARVDILLGCATEPARVQ
jgi:hypothetical protein